MPEPKQFATLGELLSELQELAKPPAGALALSDGSGTGRYPQNAHWTEYGDGTDYPSAPQIAASGHADGSGTERYSSSSELSWRNYGDLTDRLAAVPRQKLGLTKQPRAKQRPLSETTFNGPKTNPIDLTFFREHLEDYWNGDRSLEDTQTVVWPGIHQLERQLKALHHRTKDQTQKDAIWKMHFLILDHLQLIFAIARKAKGSSPPSFASPAAFQMWFELLDGECESLYWISQGVTNPDQLKQHVPKLNNAFPNYRWATDVLSFIAPFGS